MKNPNIKVKSCKTDWYDMDRREDGNRFCQNCQKVVYDLSGMSGEEAEAFWDANPGVCANFFAWQVEAVPADKDEATVPGKSASSSHWKKAAAAVAALTILHGQLPADLVQPDLRDVEIERLIGNPGTEPSTNTLLTGVLLDQWGSEISLPLILKIYRGNELIAYPVTAENGLFSVNLSGKAEPGDKITILIPTQSMHNSAFEETKIKTRLAEGQNLLIHINATYPMRLGGVRIRTDID
jgi:hypothetical protein